MEHPVAPWSTHDATGVTTPRQTVKASPNRHKWMLSHSAPADPSDPWNSHAAPVSPRQNGQSKIGPPGLHTATGGSRPRIGGRSGKLRNGGSRSRPRRAQLAHDWHTYAPS